MNKNGLKVKKIKTHMRGGETIVVMLVVMNEMTLGRR